MKKDWKISVLLDLYGKLFLTDKQYKVVDLYYNADLSLSEIAQQEAITRQGVRDSIKRGEIALLEAEEKLRFYEKQLESEKIRESVIKSANAIIENCQGSKVIEKYAMNIISCMSKLEEQE